ncbi:MAG: double zinc ribbon domain-containing protein [Thermoanaerobaculia bacterium]
MPGPEPHRPLPGAPAIASLLALLVPSRCAVCNEPRMETGGGGVCPSCWASLPRLAAGATCPRCALPTDGSPCTACRREPPPVARTLAFGLYAGGLKTLLHAFKFRGWDLLAAPCGERLAAAAAGAGLVEGADVLVPVPSTRRRNRARGYDPAALLAE